LAAGSASGGEGFAQVLVAPAGDGLAAHPGDRDRICGQCPYPDPSFGVAGFGGRDRRGLGTAVIPVPSGVRVWLAVGRTDMRKGMTGLALQVQERLKRDSHAGDLFVFRGRRLSDFRVMGWVR
jgi:IS66 Orf2 like protein